MSWSNDVWDFVSNRFAYFIVLPPPLTPLSFSLCLWILNINLNFPISPHIDTVLPGKHKTDTQLFSSVRLTSLLSTPALVYPVILHRHLSKLENSVALGGGTNKAKSRKKLLFTDSRASVLERAGRRDNAICEVWGLPSKKEREREKKTKNPIVALRNCYYINIAYFIARLILGCTRVSFAVIKITIRYNWREELLYWSYKTSSYILKKKKCKM